LKKYLLSLLFLILNLAKFVEKSVGILLVNAKHSVEWRQDCGYTKVYALLQDFE